jgi:phage shock protein PspC (stress-responsive transcriptional regulator)
VSLVDELVKLEQLRKQGVLSEDEFAQAKRRLLAGAVPPAHRLADEVNRFRRSRGERWLAGICGGLAARTGFDPWVWRLMFVLLFFFAGSGILLYLLLWVFVPEESRDV